jgi:hypothetical protein
MDTFNNVPMDVWEKIADLTDLNTFTSITTSNKVLYEALNSKIPQRVVDAWAVKLNHLVGIIRRTHDGMMEQKKGLLMKILKELMTDTSIDDDDEGEDYNGLVMMSMISNITNFIQSNLDMDVAYIVRTMQNISWQDGPITPHETLVWHSFQRYFMGDVMMWNLTWMSHDLECAFQFDFVRNIMEFNIGMQQQNDVNLYTKNVWHRFHNLGVNTGYLNNGLMISISDDGNDMMNKTYMIAQMMHDAFGHSAMMSSTRGDSIELTTCPYIRDREGEGNGGNYFYNSAYLQHLLKPIVNRCERRIRRTLA